VVSNLLGKRNYFWRKRKSRPEKGRETKGGKKLSGEEQLKTVDWGRGDRRKTTRYVLAELAVFSWTFA